MRPKVVALTNDFIAPNYRRFVREGGYVIKGGYGIQARVGKESLLVAIDIIEGTFTYGLDK